MTEYTHTLQSPRFQVTSYRRTASYSTWGLEVCNTELSLAPVIIGTGIGTSDPPCVQVLWVYSLLYAVILGLSPAKWDLKDYCQIYGV